MWVSVAVLLCLSWWRAVWSACGCQRPAKGRAEDACHGAPAATGRCVSVCVAVAVGVFVCGCVLVRRTVRTVVVCTLWVACEVWHCALLKKGGPFVPDTYIEHHWSKVTNQEDPCICNTCTYIHLVYYVSTYIRTYEHASRHFHNACS